MKKCKTLLKLSTSFALSLCMLATGVISVHAAAPPIRTVDQFVRLERAATLREFGQTAQQLYYPQDQVWANLTAVNNKRETVNNHRIIDLDNSIITEFGSVAAADAKLTNPLTNTQTLNSASITLTHKDVISSTVTHGTGVSASVGYQPPINIGGVNANLTLNYDFSKADTKTVEKSVSYTLPSQHIEVLPGQTVIVKSKLVITKFKGNIGLLSDVDASETLSYNLMRMRPGDSGYNTLGHSEKKDVRYTGSASGRASYESTFGAYLEVSLHDPANPSNKQKVVYNEQKVTENSSNKGSVNFVEVKTIDMTGGGGSVQPPDSTKVTLYEHGDFGGKNVSLGEGRYTASQFGSVGNDQVSSIKVPEGYEVILYEHGDFTGKQKTVTSNVSYLNDFNDMTSAIEIKKVGKVVSLFTESFYKGKQVDLGVGRYKMQDLINCGLGNDALSSLKVPDGLKVYMYVDDNFSGECGTSSAGTHSKLFDFFDNHISSIVIEPA